jgi:hypothetical protein
MVNVNHILKVALWCNIINCPACINPLCIINETYTWDPIYFEWSDDDMDWNVFKEGCHKCSNQRCQANQIAIEARSRHPELF